MELNSKALTATAEELDYILSTMHLLKQNVEKLHAAYSYFLMGGEFTIEWNANTTIFDSVMYIDTTTTEVTSNYLAKLGLSDRRYENVGEILLQVILACNRWINDTNAEYSISLSLLYSLQPNKVNKEDYLTLLQYYRAVRGQ